MKNALITFALVSGMFALMAGVMVLNALRWIPGA
jgi:hypothetical protein